jgi:GNAT superfamily N-acetyltransferase
VTGQLFAQLVEGSFGNNPGQDRVSHSEDRRVIFEPGLIRRIESSSAGVTLATAAAFVDRAARGPAHAVAFAGGVLAAFGPGRYVNRAVGVSLEDLDDDQLDEPESFLTAAVARSRVVGATLLARLATRGYAVSWFRNVHVAALEDRPPPVHPAMTVEEVTDDTLEEWLAVLRIGNDMTTPDAAAISDEWARASRSVAGAIDYLAYLDGTAVGCGSVIPQSGIGWIGGATTVPAYRRRGVQGALVRRRMTAAHESGRDLAVVTAVPSGDSARNIARLGFTLAYCQAVLTKWRGRPAASGPILDDASAPEPASADRYRGA